jgi:hypothetical protein
MLWLSPLPFNLLTRAALRRGGRAKSKFLSVLLGRATKQPGLIPDVDRAEYFKT